MFIGKLGPQICYDAPETPAGGTPGTPAAAAAEHPVSAPWAEAQGVWTLGEGDNAKPWWTTLPDEAARNHLEAKQYANPAELALANYNLTRLQSGDPKVLTLPAADATPEQMRSFYEKLGAPKDANGYELKFADGVQTDPGMVEFGKKAFHAAGLTPQQAQIVSDQWNAYVAEQTTALDAAATQRNTEELNALTTKWGAELDANKADGQRAIQALGLSPETVARIEASIGAAPIVELLATLGKKSREGGAIIGSLTYDANNPASMTKEQAAARIKELQGDTAFMAAYMDKNAPQHTEKVQLMQALFAKA